MTRDRFRDHFGQAVDRALAIGRLLFSDELPDTPRFLVYPNQSYDIEPDGQSLTSYPEDTLPRGHHLAPMSGVEAIDYLWRDGRVPQWIDVILAGAQSGVTLIELRCCGRYVAEEERLYHKAAGVPPFSVMG